jgi:hypothetical protein
MATLAYSAQTATAGVLLQLWGKIEHVEAPGPNELVHFRAGQEAQHATTTEQLSLIGNQVGNTGVGPANTKLTAFECGGFSQGRD